MRPILFHIGPIPIYGFGLMVAIAFLTANWLFTKEARRRRWNEHLISAVTFIALIGGITGAKLFHLLEYPQLLAEDPVGAIFSGEGLTFYGGLIVATVGVILYLSIKRTEISILELGDALSPALILAYGIGRIGCHLAGDGDYGTPTKLPWATSYAKGTVPTLAHLNPELKAKYQEMYPGEPIPYDIKVHPTPVYEAIVCVGLFVVLHRLQKRSTMPKGWLFGLYLVFAGIERFLVEFIRLNPLYLGLSQAQWISLGMVAVGVTIIATRFSNSSHSQ